MFPRNCANTCYDGSSSDLLVKTTIYYNNVSRNAYCNDYDTGILTVTGE